MPSVSVKNVNGNKEIDVTDNDTKIRIAENKDGITMTVTDPPQGDKKPKPREYKAATADELKKKHPEAYKLYEKYAKGQGVAMGNVQIAVVGQGGPVKAVAPIPRPGRLSPNRHRRAGPRRLPSSRRCPISHNYRPSKRSERRPTWAWAEKDTTVRGLLPRPWRPIGGARS